MSRGGRYGGAAGKVGGVPLPFDVDPNLESDIAAYHDNDEKAINDLSRHYPPLDVPQAPPPTAEEKRLVVLWCEEMDRRRDSPFFLDDLGIGKKDPAKFNAFEDVKSWNNLQNKRKRKNKGLPDLKKLPIVWDLLPAELKTLKTGTKDDEDDDNDQIDFSFLNKKPKALLAQLDDEEDDAEDKDAAEATSDKDADEDDGGDGDGGIEELEDDEFDEDEEDADLDYNAEKFFDDGEDDHDADDGGGHGDDAW